MNESVFRVYAYLLLVTLCFNKYNMDLFKINSIFFSYGRKKSEHPQGYDEWLGRKKALEQIKVDRRKHVEAAQKLAEEDKYVVI